MATVKIVINKIRQSKNREGAESGAMPVKWLLHWKNISNLDKKMAEDILSEMLKSIERMYAVKEGPWKNTLSFFHPNLKDLKKPTVCASECLGLSLYEDPEKFFFVLFPPKLVVEVDSNYSLLMNHLGSYKKGNFIHFEGTRYRCGDFRLRLGFASSVSLRIKAVFMEIEYLPISSIKTAEPIMEGFISLLKLLMSQTGIPGNFVCHDPKYAEFELPDQYSSMHTALQYSYLMTQLI
ncbi:Mediator of RNA polymerase II transcription subunit 20b [Zostera marina]|uniref:Mediator of RNA polymerase II transcription subunit 20 n=1 Tax=Zostera marina TaxID=29655 RepID=A0A0K9PMA1_ZOSMR|nr:Mediator of RNA polymerase II transcription subunit 20b [Zostera marina]